MILVSIQCRLKHWPLIERLKRQILYACKASLVNAEMEFRTELSWSARFPPDYWTDIWLTDTHNPAFNNMCVIVIHVLLLLIKFANYVKQILVFFIYS